MIFIWGMAIFSLVMMSVQIASILLASHRCVRAPNLPAPLANAPAVSVVRPLCGIEPFEAQTLASTFALNYPNYEILFCVADARDPVIALVQHMMAAHPTVTAQLIIGDEKFSANPKLNNVVRGWDRAKHDWIIMADSNVLMPKDYIQRMMARWQSDTGLVCACPIGSSPRNFAAQLECAFLNTYQARWQYAGERLGFGFAQGKSMLWRADILQRGGGIRALADELAEDAAATKLVHAQGLQVHLVEGPFMQPLGHRSLAAVWKRQLRWARLRRVTFPLFFAPELLMGSLWPALAGGLAAHYLGWSGPAVGLAILTVWFAAEALLARAAHWHLSIWTIPALILRDLALPVLWLEGWIGDDFVWRGNAMSVKEETQVGAGR